MWVAALMVALLPCTASAQQAEASTVSSNNRETAAGATRTTIGKPEDVVKPAGQAQLKQNGTQQSKQRKPLVVPDNIELRTIPTYACLRADSATFRFPGGHKRIMPFYRKLSNMLEGRKTRINILHLGDSHIQADIISSRIRQALTEMTDGCNADRGLLVPLSIVGGGAPTDYKITSTGRWEKSRNIERNPSRELGIAGATVATSDPSASLSVDVKSQKWAFTSIRILGQSNTGNREPVIWVDGQEIAAKRDSLPGYVFKWKSLTTTCRVTFKGAGNFELRGLIPGSRRSGITYSAAGINGATCVSWLRCGRFQEELATIRPDVVVAALGTNDANCTMANFKPEDFKNNYRRLLDSILEVNPKCFFVFVTNNDCFIGSAKTWCPTTPSSAQAIRELAEEYGGCVFDVFEIMGGARSTDKWVPAGLQQPDHIHFTPKGYNLLGDLFFNSLITDYINTANKANNQNNHK